MRGRRSFSRALIAARAFGDSLSRKIRQCARAPGTGFCTAAAAWRFIIFMARRMWLMGLPRWMHCSRGAARLLHTLALLNGHFYETQQQLWILFVLEVACFSTARICTMRIVKQKRDRVTECKLKRSERKQMGLFYFLSRDSNLLLGLCILGDCQKCDFNLFIKYFDCAIYVLHVELFLVAKCVFWN